MYWVNLATSERYPILKRSYGGRAAHPGLSGAHGEDGLGMAKSLLNHLAVELRDTIKNQDSGAFRKHFWAFKNGTKSRSFKSIIKSHKLSFRDHGQQNTMNKLRHSHHPGYARPSIHCTWFCPKMWSHPWLSLLSNAQGGADPPNMWFLS